MPLSHRSLAATKLGKSNRSGARSALREGDRVWKAAKPYEYAQIRVQTIVKYRFQINHQRTLRNEISHSLRTGGWGSNQISSTSTHVCSRIIFSSVPGTKPVASDTARDGPAIPSAWTCHAAFRGALTPRLCTRSSLGARQIKRKTTRTTSANLTITGSDPAARIRIPQMRHLIVYRQLAVHVFERDDNGGTR